MIGYLLGFRRELQLRKRRRTMVVCGDCETDNPNTAAFCSHCGSARLLEIDDFNRQENAAMQVRASQIGEEAQRNRAIRRIRELEETPYCAPCGTTLEIGRSFCNACGNKLDRLPDELIFPIVQAEYPRIIGGYRAYETCRDAIPDGTVLARGIKEGFDQFFRRLNR